VPYNSAMTAVYVLRHPQTTWNVAERYQGRLESDLSAEGRLQSRAVSRTFRGHSLDAVYSSPLQRALSMAREIAQASDSSLSIEQRLTEIAMGPWEGLDHAQIRTRYPRLYEEWYARPDAVHFPGGESIAGVQRRVLSFMSALYARHPGGHVAVVTHSAVIQALVAATLSLDLRYIHHIRISNGGITTICGTELPGSLLTLNSISTLYPSPVSGAAASDCVSWRRRRVTL